ALDGELDVIAALEQRDAETPAPTRRAGEIPAAVPGYQTVAPPRVLWFEGSSAGELVVQVRSTDRPGLLARLSAVIERKGVDVSWATVTTLGATVVDAFGLLVSEDFTGVEARTAFERDLYAVLPAPPPAKPATAAR
ncbi:[protein-PII] uridylyltransferase, partial [Mycobacterium sp. CBMA361]|nr:[protein-PII] uridylyltransferase [Mycolicibacterium sp. CBMA 361]